jgi:hypothetical protein
MKVLVSTDSSPEETFWSVHDTCNNNQLIMEGGPYIGHDKFEPISEVMCVPASKYEFTIQHVRSLHISRFLSVCSVLITFPQKN